MVVQHQFLFAHFKHLLALEALFDKFVLHKEDSFQHRIHDFFDERLESILEFTSIFRAR